MTVEQHLISFYKDAWQNDTDIEITVLEFLDGVAIGRWKPHVEWVRLALSDKKEYDKRKKSGPAVTIGGAFNKRRADSIREYSGLIATDLDHLGADLMRVFNLLKNDPYVFAVFRSIGGDGLCVLFRIDANRWLESFEGINNYLTETHGVVMGFDPSVKDVSRLRFVSYDPDIWVNLKAQIFKKYPRKEQKPKKPQTFIHSEPDIQFIVDQIHKGAVDIAPGYHDWYRMGWSLISQYGEGARAIFHEVSQYNANYDAEECERKFKYLIETRPAQITIATFYYLCKQAGLNIMTPQTREIVSVAAMSKKGKESKKSALDTVLKMVEGAERDTAEPIVEQVYDSADPVDTEETLFDQLELFLKQNYQLYFNEVRRVFEDENGSEIEESDFYSMYIRARKTVSDKLRYTDFDMLIHSHTVFPKRHPIKEFFERHKKLNPTGIIQQLVDSIDTNTGFDGSEFLPSYAGKYMRKWLIGLIGTLYGDPCAIALFLTGPPNTGKTSWFRQLLPAELESYRYETKWADTRDEHARMCTHWLSFNDEFDGKEKANMEHFKGLTTKDYFTVRLPYGSKDVRLKRLAVLCATSNPKNIINEPEYNRRIIPVNVLRVHWTIYNAIDRVALLMEAYHAYMSGERSDLTTDDIAELRDLTEEFQNKSIEQQLVDQYLSVPLGEGGEVVQYLSATEIMAKLELRVNNRKLCLNHVGAALQAAGFERKSKKIAGKVNKLYQVIILE